MAAEPWWLTDPALLADIQETLTGPYSSLSLLVTDNSIRVSGVFPVLHDGEVLDRYDVEVDFPDGYADDPPTVKEVGGRIPHVVERHNSTGTACLFVPIDWKMRRSNLRFRTFLDEPVKRYFASQSLVAEGKPWPCDERSHGYEGIGEALRDLIGLATSEQGFLSLTLLAKDQIKGHWDCLCGSGKRLRDCHGAALWKLHNPSNTAWARDTLKGFADMIRRQQELAAELAAMQTEIGAAA